MMLKIVSFESPLEFTSNGFLRIHIKGELTKKLEKIVFSVRSIGDDSAAPALI